ncbi:MAG TPA: FtsX-like permease family protein [Anaerolineae bacterium]|nr:FtsX-like permease family protein [Anaerolineae bacterium]
MRGDLMNPLSTYTYYRRHKRHAALLLSLSLLIAAGLFSMIALAWAIFVEQPRKSYMALSEFSIVTPAADSSVQDPTILATLLANPDIVDVFPARTINIQLPGLLEADSLQFELYGLMEEDIDNVLRRLKATFKEGQLPIPGTNGLVISEDVAFMLDLKVGDNYETISSEFYPDVDIPLEPTTFEIVGILESDLELGIVSREFLNNHRLYRQFPDRFLILAKEDREEAVDGFLRNEIQSIHTSVMTLSMLNERIISEALPGLVMLLPIVLIVVVAFSFLIVVVNRIANAGRLPEFGILHATGYSKQFLSRRLTLETATLALAGWLGGIGLSFLILSILRAVIFWPRGYDLDFRAWIPIVFTLPLPAIIAGFTFVSIRRTLRRLDPVAIVERGQLSHEGEGKAIRTRAKSSPRPLAAVTFYSRHKRRAAWLVGSMSLMIMAVMLFIFALAVTADARVPLLGYLSRVTIIGLSGLGQTLDPSVATGLENHPAVDRLIPVAPRYHMLDIYIPPFTSAEASPFAVYAEDMNYLVDLFDLELKEGSLPRSGTNEMVIPEVLAQNRHIEVGTTIGDPAQPAYPGATSLPVEFVVSGIFERPKSGESGNGLGFISLEFLDDAEPFPLPDTMPMFVVAKEEQKEKLDHWLENEIAAANVSLLTFEREVARVQQKAQQDMLSIGILESIIALVAALGLAVLNYIYISQRQTEFGVLHALGYGRRQLVGRVLGETAFTTIVAWLLSACICLIGMLGLRLILFAPRGLSFDLINITPWLYTLPIPVLVLAVTAIVTARTLSKLDAVTIVERRVA